MSPTSGARPTGTTLDATIPLTRQLSTTPLTPRPNSLLLAGRAPSSARYAIPSDPFVWPAATGMNSDGGAGPASRSRSCNPAGVGVPAVLPAGIPARVAVPLLRDGIGGWFRAAFGGLRAASSFRKPIHISRPAARPARGDVALLEACM